MEQAPARLVRLSQSGTILGTLDPTGFGGGLQSFPQGIAVKDGVIFMTEGQGTSTSCCSNWRVLRIDTATPTASISASPSPALTGETVSFDASSSSVPLSQITDYQWDLNGDGTFETDTATSPTSSAIGPITCGEP